MGLAVAGREVYAYTGARPRVPAQRTIVFVHGAANDHGVWAWQSRYFAHHGFNVLAVDLPGHGRSEGAALASVEAVADWIVALLDAAGAERAALVGHSLGALAALECAARHPERVEKIVLAGAGGADDGERRADGRRATQRPHRVRDDQRLVVFARRGSSVATRCRVSG